MPSSDFAHQERVISDVLFDTAERIAVVSTREGHVRTELTDAARVDHNHGMTVLHQSLEKLALLLPAGAFIAVDTDDRRFFLMRPGGNPGDPKVGQFGIETEQFR